MPTDPITSYSVTVGTAVVPVVGMSNDGQIAVIQNQEPSSTMSDYARDGYLYLLQRQFTVVQSGTASFSVTTGETGMQIEFYEITSTVSNLKGELVEGASITTTGSAIPAYNLNRNESDAHDTVFLAASTATGGTVISAELITADKHAAAGGSQSAKVHTLAPSTQYAFRFINQGNQDTSVFFQMGFAEKYNGYNDVWLGGTVGDGIRLRGGQTLQLPMIQGQTLNGVASADSEIGVLRQD